MTEPTGRLRIFSFYIVLPILLLWGISKIGFDSGPAVEWLSKYRPSAGESNLELNVSRQVLAIDAALRAPTPLPRIAITGSSAVVNGVDADEINRLWQAEGVRHVAVNFGQTGFVAYELALLRRFLLDPSIDTVVFLYNSFSFADRLLATVVGVRWDTREMLALRPPVWYRPDDWRRYATGILNENLGVLRYGAVLKSIAARAVSGTLQPLASFPDFPPEAALDPPRERVAHRPAPESDWLRAAYLDSERRTLSFGYRGFERFLSLAARHGIRVIVAPVPEPAFSRLNKWRIGTDPDIVDRRVAALAAPYDAIVWPRKTVAPLEADDTLFRDQTHFNRFGRERYSRALAEWIAAEVK